MPSKSCKFGSSYVGNRSLETESKEKATGSKDNSGEASPTSAITFPKTKTRTREHGGHVGATSYSPVDGKLLFLVGGFTDVIINLGSKPFTISTR